MLCVIWERGLVRDSFTFPAKSRHKHPTVKPTGHCRSWKKPSTAWKMACITLKQATVAHTYNASTWAQEGGALGIKARPQPGGHETLLQKSISHLTNQHEVYLYLGITVWENSVKPFTGLLCGQPIFSVTEGFSSLLQVLYFLLSALGLMVCMLAVAFAAHHCSLLAQFTCETSLDSCLCKLPSSEPLSRTFVYRDVADCTSITGTFKLFLIIQMVLNLVCGLVCLLACFVMWKHRYQVFYVGVGLRSLMTSDGQQQKT